MVTDTQWWLFCFGVLLSPIILFELGFHFGWQRKVSREHRSLASTTVTAQLTLFGLLLAFTFGIAEGRFADRKKVVLKEANAIGTTFLRSDFLPEAQRKEVKSLLREYTIERLKGSSAEDPRPSIERSEQIQKLIWENASLAALTDVRSIPTGLFIQSLNELIDTHEERLTYAVYFKLPNSILWILSIVGVLAASLLGYSMGLSRRRHSILTLPLIFAFCAVILMIMDLDQVTPRFVSISQKPIADVLSTIEAGIGI